MTDSYGIGLPMTTEYGELNIFDFSGTEGMEKELDLSGDISSNSESQNNSFNREENNEENDQQWKMDAGEENREETKTEGLPI